MRSARDVVHFSSNLDVRAIAGSWANDHGYRMLGMSNAGVVYGKRAQLVALPVMVELASRDRAHTLSCWGRRTRAQREINELLWALGAPPLGGSRQP